MITADWENPLFDVWVQGLPAAQGSKKYAGHRWSPKAGRPVPLLLEESHAVEPWRNLVTGTAQLRLNRYRGWKPLDEPLGVVLDVYVPRPRTVTRPLPTVPPDVDKLTRAVFDAFTKAGVWEDDSRVVDVAAGKRYAIDQPGARVRVYPVVL